MQLLNGLDFKRGDEVINTDQEHGGGAGGNLRENIYKVKLLRHLKKNKFTLHVNKNDFQIVED